MNTKWGKITSSCKTPLLDKSENSTYGLPTTTLCQKNFVNGQLVLLKKFALIDESWT